MAIDPLAYRPGETLEEFLAAQKTAQAPGQSFEDPYNPNTGLYTATNDYYAAQNKAINTTPGRGVQDYWSQGERKTGSNWNELANLIGFQGPVSSDKTGYYWADNATDAEGTPMPGYWGQTGIPQVSTEFRTALKDYAFVPKNDRGAPAVDIYDPSGKLISSQRTAELPQGFEKYGPAIAAMIATAMSAGTLGPALGGMLGLGEAGLTAAELATLGELGINTAMIDAGTIAALGTGATSAGKTALQGGDFGDVLESGLTSLAGSYAGSTVNNALPTSVSNTGIRSLDTAIDKGIRGAAGAATSSIVKGNSPEEALQSALLAGAGATTSSVANSAVGDTVGQLGIPKSALNILGPAAVAELMGGDGTSAAIKAAVNEAIGGIKGVRIPAKSGAVGPGSPTSQELDQEFDDGSSLVVNRKGDISSLDTGGQRYAPGSNPFLQKNIDAAAYQQDVAPFLSQAADNPLLPESIRPEDRAYIEGRLKNGDDAKDVLADLVTAGNKQDYAERLFTAVARDAPFPTEKEFEPSSGDPDKVLQDAGLVQKDAAITEQAPVEITGQTPSDYGLDFGAFAERPEATASLDAAPQKVEVTGQTPDTELMRFLEANGLTADEAQKVLEGTPTPKVVVQGQTPPKDTAVDDLMALLGPYDTQLDNTQRVDITGNTPKEGVSTDLPSALLGPTTSDEQEANRVEITAKKLLQDMGLDLGAYNEGPVVAPDKLTDNITQTVPITGTKVKDELDPNFFYQPDEVASDKLTDDLTQEVEITGNKLPNTLLDYSSLENVPEEFPFIYPGEETPPEVNPQGPVVEPVKPGVKPVVPKVPVVTPPGTTTTPGASYTIPGSTQQLHQELMNLPETDILRMLNPALYAYKDAQKRKKLSEEDQMTALLNELGYRS